MGKLRIEVVYALPQGADAVTVLLPAGARAQDAIAASGMLERHPELDPARTALGVFGRRVAPSAPLADGDRLEIYRPLEIDPKEARRRRAVRGR